MDVIENRLLCENHYLIRLAGGDFPRSKPGQFVQIQCRPVDQQVSGKVVEWNENSWPEIEQPELTGTEPILRRPLSLAGHDGDTIEIIYRVAGMGTKWLSGVSAGEKISVIGPLGNAFDVYENDPKKKAALLVGGGVGIPPMIYLAGATSKKLKTIAFCGVRNEHMIPLSLDIDVEVHKDGTPSLCVHEFAKNGVETVITSDDGSVGYSGLVCEPFEKWIDECEYSPEELSVYTCGPELMMRAIAESCINRGIDCQVSLERHMGCGMGTCQSCVCKIKADNEKGYVYKLCCSDGPVFDAKVIVW